MQRGRVALEQNEYFKMSSTTPRCLIHTTENHNCAVIAQKFIKEQYLQPFSSTHSSILSCTPASEDDAAPWFVAICKEIKRD